MRREIPADADLSSGLGTVAQECDACLDTGPAALLSRGGRRIGGWGGSGWRVVQHRRIRDIDERSLQAKPLPNGNRDVLRYADLRVPRPQIAGPGKGGNGDRSERVGRERTDNRTIIGEEGLGVLPVKHCMRGAEAQNIAVVRSAATPGGLRASVEIQAQVGSTCGAEQMRSVSLKTENCLLYRGTGAARTR